MRSGAGWNRALGARSIRVLTALALTQNGYKLGYVTANLDLSFMAVSTNNVWKTPHFTYFQRETR
jgi:hypothetical protein